MPNTLDNSIPIENVATLLDPLPTIVMFFHNYHIVQELLHTPSEQTLSTYICLPRGHNYDKLSNL